MLRISPALARYAEKQRKQIERLKQRSKNELESLSPGFRRKIETILAHLEGKGWTPVVFHGERTKEEQAKIVKAGHSKTMQSFHVRDTSLNRGRNGLYWQVKGEAADIVDARFLWSGPASDLDFQFWKDLGAIAKSLGLKWGGDWKNFKDVAHVEDTHFEISQDSRGLRA
jgi:peptidoglycan L-alanyl-D-glutamate endopeptidase CwlK